MAARLLLGDVLFGFSQGEDAAAIHLGGSLRPMPNPGLARTDRREGAPDSRAKVLLSRVSLP